MQKISKYGKPVKKDPERDSRKKYVDCYKEQWNFDDIVLDYMGCYMISSRFEKLARFDFIN